MDEQSTAWATRYHLLPGLNGIHRNRLIGLGFRTLAQIRAASDADLMRPAVWQGNRVNGLTRSSVRTLRRALARTGPTWNTCG